MKKGKKSSNQADRPTDHGRLRIIAGEMRTRIIEFSTDPRTRPMKDRTREAVFNLLGGKLHGFVAADLFAGSGILGFESLSRGAEHAVIIELLHRASREIRDNAKRLEVLDKVTLQTADTFEWAEKLEERLKWLREDQAIQAETPWCVFVCPPYRLWETDGPRLRELIDRWIAAVPLKSSFVIELDLTTSRDILPSGIDWDVREYRPAVMAIGDKV